MILELDCGNTLIKWRTLSAEGATGAGGVVESVEQLLEVLGASAAPDIQACRMVSVRSDDETRDIAHALAEALGVIAVQAHAAPWLAGVRNGYEDYSRLGLDRWLALVAAFNLAQKACLVLDLGTAVTSDFVDAEGQHLGGFICPGLPLMRSQLQLHTRRIRYSLVADALASGWMPGRATVDAVERGCALMLRSFAVGQMELAREYFGEDFAVFVTGGDAPLIEDVLSECRLVPDLVFAGLALACPLT